MIGPDDVVMSLAETAICATSAHTQIMRQQTTENTRYEPKKSIVHEQTYLSMYIYDHFARSKCADLINMNTIVSLISSDIKKDGFCF